MRRQAVLAAALAVALTVSARADEEPIAPIALDYVGAPGCPARGAFVAALGARSDRLRVVEEASARWSVRFSSAPGGYLAELSGGAPGARRRVEGTDCTQIADAIALVLALAVDPSARMLDAPSVASFEQPNPSASVAASSASLPMPSAAASVSALVPESGDATRAVRRPTPRARIAAPPTVAPPPWHLGYEFGVIGGIASGLAPTLALGASREYASLRFRAGLRGARATAPSAELTQIAFQSAACPRAWQLGRGWGATLCAGYEAGVLHAQGVGVEDAASALRIWVAPRLQVLGRWQFSAAAALELGLELRVPLVRQRYFVAPDRTLYTVPAVAGGVTLGLDFTLP